MGAPPQTPKPGTPKNPPSLKKSTSGSQSTLSQKSINSFFQKRTIEGQVAKVNVPSKLPTTPQVTTNGAQRKALRQTSSSSLTPAPSSDAIDEDDMRDNLPTRTPKANGTNGLPSPVNPADAAVTINGSKAGFDSPSRKAKKFISYAESGSDEDDEDAFDPTPGTKSRGRASKRRKTAQIDDEEEFAQGSDDEFGVVDEDDFLIPDELEEEVVQTKKRKRSSAPKPTIRSSPPVEPLEVEDDVDIPAPSTAQQWKYDPDNVEPLQPRSANIVSKKPDPSAKKVKQKAHVTEPEDRYPWLATITDADRNPPGHPDYDPRTVYIPPLAWSNFRPFEKQYWEIKQKFMDTIVFFKKGKFYELYENDATIGHQLFDLKLTDRVNMRMVGVPESSLDHWATQFIAKGYKIARVDQLESALAKEMREQGENASNAKAKASKDDKVIKRELACVLTRGTLVDAGMLQDDMSTYVVSIKESEQDGRPAFGIAFADTATGQFYLTDIVDDASMTKFETFIAQTRPQELILEKSHVSADTMRILKNNTGPTTIWNHLKSGKEFWSAEVSCRELDASSYFVAEGRSNVENWPRALREAREKELVMSAFGALVQYFRTLKIDRDLLTMGNFDWYDPIRKASSLVLDGKTLINLEVFANSFDGGSNGTLFTLLNRCITPFGKREFKQWVCHPLMDAARINSRLDAVESLNADSTIRDQFTSSLTKLPDLERMISRIHAGSCKAQDFVRVLDGFEQIEYTMSLLQSVGSGDGVIGQLITAMPDLKSVLEPWKTAFDHAKARDEGLLIPERGVEEDFDASQDDIEQIMGELDDELQQVRKQLKSSAIVYRDNGKEIFQLEIPIKVSGVPKKWDQMSATQKVKRYYSPEVRSLVRRLQEARETHKDIVKEVSARFFVRFGQYHATWLSAVRIIAQLDCLISLAKASSAMGSPSCRPQFVSSDRSILEFTDLRHPCMLSTVDDFIPNDITLGGDSPNLNLLTGANAAGKSTILRMTCTAVLMAQIGAYVPCSSARLTPVDRIMSRLGANDNIFAAQSTFFVELAETKKILSEATPRSLVILDELGRGTSSYDGVAVAQAVLHHVATHIGALGFFATHYHSLAEEFASHPEVRNMRMQIHVDEAARRVAFLYKLEEGVAEGSFGMHCASMCGIPKGVVDRAEVAAKEWEHTSRLKESLEVAKQGVWVPLGWCSDVAWMLKAALGEGVDGEEQVVEERGLDCLRAAIEAL